MLSHYQREMPCWGTSGPHLNAGASALVLFGQHCDALKDLIGTVRASGLPQDRQRDHGAFLSKKHFSLALKLHSLHSCGSRVQIWWFFWDISTLLKTALICTTKWRSFNPEAVLFSALCVVSWCNEAIYQLTAPCYSALLYNKLSIWRFKKTHLDLGLIMFAMKHSFKYTLLCVTWLC